MKTRLGNDTDQFSKLKLHFKVNLLRLSLFKVLVYNVVSSTLFQALTSTQGERPDQQFPMQTFPLQKFLRSSHKTEEAI